MLRRARRRLQAVPVTVAGVAEALPFANDAFDIVLLVTVLGELDDAPAALREVQRVLRPRGVLSISEHLPDPDFRSLTAVRALVGALGFVEAEARGTRWSYTANFTKREI
jgi:ubiquinone/menaquinone biosynthesis C-methylase UbiE